MLNLNKNELKAVEKFKELCATFNSKLNSPHSELRYRYILSESNGLGQQCILECNTLDASEEIADYASW